MKMNRILYPVLGTAMAVLLFIGWRMVVDGGEDAVGYSECAAGRPVLSATSPTVTGNAVRPSVRKRAQAGGAEQHGSLDDLIGGLGAVRSVPGGKARKIDHGRAARGVLGLGHMSSSGPKLKRRGGIQRYGAGLMMPELRMPTASSRVHPGGEEYGRITENGFMNALDNPLSTFSIDVDAASYANVRRFLNRNTMPPVDAVRIEELINYFSYRYPEPSGKHPFSITTEAAPCPWNGGHLLLQVGLQGRTVRTADLPPANLVFLIDVSGSMASPDKLPLLKRAFCMLAGQLRACDRVGIVVYAGAAGVVLEPTRGDETAVILAAVDRLQSGGSTAGAEGIELAYRLAGKRFMKKGVNRVVLATDGDFNVGVSDDAALVKMIEEKRKVGISLTVLGFGTGNYKDAKMEQLADKGNGNYAYIDNLLEAKKVLVKELGGTLHTIAKDVKICIEFNPAYVKEYRLIGYENRMLATEDFKDDKKDAGELGAGHTVTALYELVPGRAERAEKLKYRAQDASVAGPVTRELATVKFRYKQPQGTVSTLLTHVVPRCDDDGREPTEAFRFAAAVAGWGMLLRGSGHAGGWTMDDVLAYGKRARGADPDGYRAEFLKLVETSALLAPSFANVD